MNSLAGIFDGPLVQSLGWALVHSSWQGALIGLMLANLLWLMRRSTAAARYVVAGVGLLALLICLPVTATIVFANSNLPASVQHEMPGTGTDLAESPLDQVSLATPLPDPSREPGVSDRVRNQETSELDLETSLRRTTDRPVVEATPPSTLPSSERYPFSAIAGRLLPWLVALWLTGVLVQACWQLGGWLRLRRVCRNHVSRVSGRVSRRCRTVAECLGVRQAVRLWESASVAVPAVIGAFRPVILLPASVLTGLTDEQLKAILAHELAHVRRHDYLINLFQVVAETLLFYHPAAWWINRQIRTERENCCDDLAMQVCGDRVLYAGALARLEEIRGSATAPALSAAANGSSSGGSLMLRIRRIVGLVEPKPRSPRAPWGTILALVLIATLAACYTLAGGGPPRGKEGAAEAVVTDQAKQDEIEFRPIDLNHARILLQFGPSHWGNKQYPQLVLGEKTPAGIFGVGPFPIDEIPPADWVYWKRFKDELPGGSAELAGLVIYDARSNDRADDPARLEAQQFTRVGSKITLRFKYVPPAVGDKVTQAAAFFRTDLPELPAGDYHVEAVFDTYRRTGEGKLVRDIKSRSTIKSLTCKIAAPNAGVSADLKQLAERAIALKPTAGPKGDSDQNPTGLFLGEAGEYRTMQASTLDLGNADAKVLAATEMERVANPNSVPELLAAAKRNNYAVAGSENATLHDLYRKRLKSALEKITGVSLTPKGLKAFTTGPDGKRRELRSEDSPQHFAGEVDFAKVEQWLRRVYLSDHAPQNASRIGANQPRPGGAADVFPPIAWKQKLDRWENGPPVETADSGSERKELSGLFAVGPYKNDIFGADPFVAIVEPDARHVFEKRVKNELGDGCAAIVGCVQGAQFDTEGQRNPDGGGRLIPTLSFSRLGSKITLQICCYGKAIDHKQVKSTAYFLVRLPDLPAGDYQIDAVFLEVHQDEGGELPPAENAVGRKVHLPSCRMAVPRREKSADLKQLAERAIALAPATAPVDGVPQNSTGLFTGSDDEYETLLASTLDLGDAVDRMRVVSHMTDAPDANFVPELLAAAKRNNYLLPGGRAGGNQKAYRTKLKVALEENTRLSLTPAGLTVDVPDTDGQPRLLRSEESPEHFREEIDFAKVERWLRVVYLADGAAPKDATGTAPKPSSNVDRSATRVSAEPAKPARVGVEFRRAETEAVDDGLIEATVAGTKDVIYMHRVPDATGEDIATAQLAKDAAGNPTVAITFTEQGAKKMAELSAQHKGKPLAIVVGGKVVSAPILRERISKRAVITGKFTEDEVRTLIKQISGRQTSSKPSAVLPKSQGRPFGSSLPAAGLDGADVAAMQKTMDRVRGALAAGWSLRRDGGKLIIQRDARVRVQRIYPGMPGREPGEPDDTIEAERYEITLRLQARLSAAEVASRREALQRTIDEQQKLMASFRDPPGVKPSGLGYLPRNDVQRTQLEVYRKSRSALHSLPSYFDEHVSVRITDSLGFGIHGRDGYSLDKGPRESCAATLNMVTELFNRYADVGVSWGKEQHGLQFGLRLRGASNQFRFGEPVRFDALVRNTGDSEWRIQNPGEWSFRRTEQGKLRMTVGPIWKAGSESAAKAKVTGEIVVAPGESLVFARPVWPARPVDMNDLVGVHSFIGEPGQYTVDLKVSKLCFTVDGPQLDRTLEFESGEVQFVRVSMEETKPGDSVPDGAE